MVSLVLARLLGAGGYGAYTFAIACVGVLSVPALLGFDGLLLREVAKYRAQSQWPLLHGVMRRARQLTLLASLVLLLAAAGVAWALSAWLDRSMLVVLWIGLLALPILTQIRVIQAVMIGLRNVMFAQVPDMLVQPVLLLVLVGGAAAVQEMSLDAVSAIALYGASVLPAWLLAARFLDRERRALEPLHAPEYHTGSWLRAGLPFAMTTGISVLGASLGVLMLGPMEGPAATGIFGVVAAVAALISLPLAAINTPLAPTISGVFSEGNMVELQRLATKSARGAFLICVPLAIAYAAVGYWLLGLFGAEFTAGYPALIILTAAQLFNAGTGSVGVLLQMTGHERDALRCLLLALAANFATNLWAIPHLGVTGPAIGAAVSLVLWNLIMALLVHRKLGIRPTVFG